MNVHSLSSSGNRNTCLFQSVLSIFNSVALLFFCSGTVRSTSPSRAIPYKFTVFTAAADGGAVPLVVVGVIASAAAVFFYVRLIVLMYFTPEREEEGEEGVTVVTSSGFTTVVIAVAAIGTVLLGVLPGPLLELLGQAVKFLP